MEPQEKTIETLTGTITNLPNAGGFEPEILAFCCNYCAFAAADLAGVMRLSYPPNIKIIRIPCTGKLDISYILKAFEKGADGVIVAGCEEGSCHFQKGNLIAKKRVEYTKKLLREIGIEDSRLEMFNLSSAMGSKFAQIASEMTEQIKKLGPSPLRATEGLKNQRTEEQTAGK